MSRIIIALSHAVVAGAALGLGYYLGSRLGIQNAAPATGPIPPSESKDKEPPKEPEVDSEEEDEALADGDLDTIKAGFMQPCKLVRARVQFIPVPLTSTSKGLSCANGSQNDLRKNSCTVSAIRPRSGHF